jgi:hypothetical protein
VATGSYREFNEIVTACNFPATALQRFGPFSARIGGCRLWPA